MEDTQYKEVLISVVACMALFVMTTTIILVFVFKYIRRRRMQELQVLELRQQFQQQTLQAQIEIQEQTLQAVSQEIHDNVGQVLSLAKIQANLLREYGDYSPAKLDALKDTIGKALADLRDLSRSLNNEYLQTSLLHEAVMEEAARINRTGCIHMQVDVEGNYQEIDPNKKLILYRIIQESIQNCLKHAVASQLNICCQYQPDSIRVRIHDNGKGFDANAILANGKGQGLANIRRRIALAGGSHAIESIPQQGTQITLTLPYQ